MLLRVAVTMQGDSHLWRLARSRNWRWYGQAEVRPQQNKEKQPELRRK